MLGRSIQLGDSLIQYSVHGQAYSAFADEVQKVTGYLISQSIQVPGSEEL